MISGAKEKIMLTLEWKTEIGKTLFNTWGNGFNRAYILSEFGSFDSVELWYPQNMDNDVLEEWGDIVRYIELNSGKDSKSTTRIIDLQQSIETIFSGFTKNTRYEIRRAESREQLTIETIQHPTINDILEYKEFYNNFAASKGLYRLDLIKTKALAENKCLVLSRIKDNDNVLAYHAYIYEAKERAALTTSSSLYKLNKENAPLIGMANRLLHYKDIIYFKEIGTKIYDLGGIYMKNDNLEFANVAKFKASFGGEIEYGGPGIVIPMREIRSIHKLLKEISLDNKKIVLFGYNNFNKYLYKQLNKIGLRAAAVIDNNHYGTKDTIRIFNNSYLEDCFPEHTVLLCSCSENTYSKLENTCFQKYGYQNGRNLFNIRYYNG